MYKKIDLIKDIKNLGILPTDTLLVHSSMKAIGEVEGRADTVLDALTECLRDGLLVLPTHSWATVNDEHNVYDVLKEPSCVGILSNLFLKRANVLRSWHPSHSVAALGKDAAEFVSGEENSDSPCPRLGCWGKLYDKKAKILFLGCSTKRNTYLHGVEEWNDIPERLSETFMDIKIITPQGQVIDRPLRRHQSPVKDVSQFYDKIQDACFAKGISIKGKIGDAECVLCDAVSMADLTTSFLKKNPQLFADDAPIKLVES